jgi:hypothetical protein
MLWRTGAFHLAKVLRLSADCGETRTGQDVWRMISHTVSVSDAF